MRHARIKSDGPGFYHALSRIIERRFILSLVEQEALLRLMRNLEGFSSIQILTYSFMANHFHILLKVPQRQEVSDDDLIRRLAFLYEPFQVEQVRLQLADYRHQGDAAAAESLKAQFTYRMYDLSEFFKTFKQRFSQWYNRRTGRNGPLWEQRFKSVLVEGSGQALSTMAAYIDLNAVRAGVVRDPKEYRYCGYGEAVAGSEAARRGLAQVMPAASWAEVQGLYRQYLYVRGQEKGRDAEGRPIRSGFTVEQVAEVLKQGGKLPLHEGLRCRVRYFSDGLVLGSREFAEGVFQRYRDHFGRKRQTGARAMRYGDWGGLCTLRDLRLMPVAPSG